MGISRGHSMGKMIMNLAGLRCTAFEKIPWPTAFCVESMVNLWYTTHAILDADVLIFVQL